MSGRGTTAAFLRSRECSGFLIIMLFASVLAALASIGFYRASLRSFTATTSDEVTTTLRLVDAFTDAYSNLRTAFKSAQAPVPATFRAQVIARFNHASPSRNVLRLLAVGPAGREIATPPADRQMAAAIAAFGAEAHPAPSSQFLGVGAARVFRTIYPSIASQQSCVDCHNALRPAQHWKLNEVMGAFVVDVPVAAFLHGLRLQSIAIGAVSWMLMAAVALGISLSHFRRIAERRAAEERLAHGERRFRDFAEATSDWFWEQDENLLLSFVSDNAASRRVGSGPSMIGKTRREVVHLGVSEEEWRAHDDDQRARRPFQKFRFQRIDDSGAVRHVELNGKPIFDDAGRFRGYRGTAHDVTVDVENERELTKRVEERTAELKRVQDELLRKERLSTLGQFTATIAHELRNPLSAIRNTAFAIAEAANARGLGLERPIGRLERSVARCDRLIADLLEYTRVRELKRAAIALDPWLDEVLDEQRMPAGIVVERDFAAAGQLLSVDADCLRRVIINLVENACQAMADMPADSGERRLVLRTRVAEEGVTVAIEDSGPGIAPEVLPRVFDPLFSTKSFGTGLGLPTVRQIVEQHGGTIELASEPGHGVRVLVWLPLSPVVAEELAA